MRDSTGWRRRRDWFFCHAVQRGYRPNRLHNGRIYEYFLGEFARTEGQKGGEFYTPSCIVRLLTEVIEPYHGRILDPACGSGGMFVAVGAVCIGAQEEPPLPSSPFTVLRRLTRPAASAG
ncbi:HsdM family class I SAM-dependent methyltransferase [Rhodoplanes sp. Z2-YC6860]|uniref:HsdM family class I SAM-dependent methyltransferase n=1 Tax=Rhodoplanes sp. Z2-YC6860 TaxID=674703 RepID=UPI001F1EC1B6|nr:N-6 DNA methylase [Rhodoplanes sp. Z2-YC6860]